MTMNKGQNNNKSQRILKPNLQQRLQFRLKNSLPILSSKDLVDQTSNLYTTTKKSFLSSPFIDKTKKNLQMMKRLNLINNQVYSSSQQEQQIFNRIQSGKRNKIVLPELTILKVNKDKMTYLKQPMIKQTLIGQQAISKFYKRYKSLDKKKQQEQFFNEKNIMTRIVSLLQIHNFTPRKLTIIKMKGSQAILDLKKLGLGQSNLGVVISQIMNLLDTFQQVDLSYNRIDPILAEFLIQKLKKTKRIDLSHNKIGKIGCQKFSNIFLSVHNRIQQLNLQENGLLDNAGAILIQNLLKSKNLKKLNLNKNYLGLKFAKQLKYFLEGGDKQLTQLYLNWNQFSDKAVRVILQALPQHYYLKVFDFSWNKISQDNIPYLAKVIQEAENIVHMDISFCQIRLKSIPRIAQALVNNQTIYGIHFQGNSGYIDHKGFLIPTQKEFHQYPLPLMKGLIRKLDGIKPTCHNDYITSNIRDICWICSSWQEKYFQFAITQHFKQLLQQKNIQNYQLFVHFKHQNYRGVKMAYNKQSNKYQLNRMFPIENIQFFFTFYKRPGYMLTYASQKYSVIQEELKLSFFIGTILINQVVKVRNCIGCPYELNPIDQDYDPNINVVPRSPQVPILNNKGAMTLVKKKRKVRRQEKVKMIFKDVDNEDSDFLKDKQNRDDQVCIMFYVGNQQDIQQFIKKCIEFDIKNSKIPKIIKDTVQIQQLKKLLLKYYRSFKDTFYYLARNYPNIHNIFSINEYDFSLFLEQQRYITKRVTFDKIMLKLYASLAAGEETFDLKGKPQKNTKKQEKSSAVKFHNRPQFLQFMIRLAIQKWCNYTPKKAKPKKIQKFYQQDLLQLKKSKQLGSQKSFKLKKQSKNPSVKQQKQKKTVIQQQKTIDIAKEQQLMINSAKEQQQQEQQQRQMKKSKIQLPLPLMDGIQRTLKTLIRYGQTYKSSNWRKGKYLKNDNLIVIKAYWQFLHSLFFKYVQSTPKTMKPKKLHGFLTLQQLRKMMINSNIAKLKQQMRLVEQAFLDSKRLQVQDGILYFGLNEDEFIECLARISQFIWFNPVAAKQAELWGNEINKKNTPLFLKFQALIIQIYSKEHQLQNKKMSRAIQKGIFGLQIELIMQKIQDRYYQSGNYGLLRKNSIQISNQISLKQIIYQLRQKYDKMVIIHEHEEQYNVVQENKLI